MRAPHHRYTWDQYVALCEGSNVKLEYFDGEIYAMAGGTPAHAALAMAVAIEIGKQLDGKPCRVYSSDLQIRVGKLGTFPDVSIICGEPRLAAGDRNAVTNPTVLIEVLSDSTEDYDRAGKFDSYREILSLQEYVLVSHHEPLIEVFRRRDDADWIRTAARAGGSVPLESNACTLQVDRVYRDVTLSG